MSDNQEVLIAKDDGHKKRWAFDRLPYFKDGQKKTLRSKEMKVAAGVFFGVTALWALLQSPAPNQAKSESIPLKEAVVNQDGSILIKKEGVPLTEKKSSLRPRPQKYEGLKVHTRPRVDKIPPGLSVRAKLITGASDGPTKAVLIESLVVNGEEILPKDAVILGTGSSHDDRLQIKFSKAIFSDGTIQKFESDAFDSNDNLIGLKGSKVSKFASSLAASAGMSFLVGLSEGLQEKENRGGLEIPKADLKNAAYRGVQVASIEQSKEIVTKWKESKSSIRVPAETEILILTAGE